MPFKNPAPNGSSKSRVWIEQDLARLNHSQLATDFTDYRAARLAATYGVTLRQLRRYFQKSFGLSPKDWLFEKRMTIAHRLLETGESVKTVAIQLGFKQPSHFGSVFKRRYGLSPSACHNLNTSRKRDTSQMS
ncbi:MAG: helix-turn-helix transcriptional regulator [Verrucomicrobia bacterium]|nr:helix-turn-helix transcriptional regulator [Verrucomicrobiota bacterium]